MNSDHQQALVLDFGGVISRTLFETHPDTEAALGLAPGTLTWRGPFDPESDPLWQSMQRDEISERDYWCQRTAEVGQLVGQQWTQMHEFVRAGRGSDPDRVIRPEALIALNIARRSGYKLAILSNELDLFYGREFRDRLPFMQWFDVITDATYTEILKPDPRAYVLCLQSLHVQPEQCVFVDDQFRNIKGARNVGMQTVHFSFMEPEPGYRQALELLGLDYDADQQY